MSLLERDPASPPRACPVCGGSERETLFRQRFAVVEAASLLSGYDVVICSDCGAGFADNLPPQSAFDTYYREMSKYEYHQREGAASEHDHARFELIADLLGPLLSSDSAILDVGCATGALLGVLKRRGFSNVQGIDPSPACAKIARELYGVEVVPSTLRELAVRGQRFDAVVLIGVLEHLREVGTSLDDIGEVLTNRGVVFVEVPDALAFADWPNAPFQDFSIEHINFFSPMSLRNTFARRGFRELMCRQNAREQSHRVWMSNVSAAFGKADRSSLALTRDENTKPALERYVAQCIADERALLDRIAEVANSGRPIIVWGVGTHTQRLLVASQLHKANIVAFVDSNVGYVGKEIRGVSVIAPAEVAGRAEPILISSRVFQHEIVRQIRQELHLPNELILLYNET